MIQIKNAQRAGNQTAAKRKPANPMQRVKIRRRIRAVIQLIFFLLAPAVYTSCFSSIKSIATAIGAGEPFAYDTFFTTLIVICLYTIIFGRFFCGYACAFGSLGDAVYALSQLVQRKIKKKLPQIPEKAVRVMQKLKYVILIAIVVLCVAGVYDRLSGWSPWDVFSMLTALRGISTAYAIGAVLLVLIMIGMAVKERFFCQFLCPMGAVFAVLPVIGGYHRNRENCLPHCSACEKNCPVCVETDENNLRMGECISCGKCSDICPKRNIQYGEKIKDGNAPFPVILKALLLFAICLILGVVRTF